jgi:hypothetical protein
VAQFNLIIISLDIVLEMNNQDIGLNCVRVYLQFLCYIKKEWYISSNPWFWHSKDQEFPASGGEGRGGGHEIHGHDNRGAGDDPSSGNGKWCRCRDKLRPEAMMASE